MTNVAFKVPVLHHCFIFAAFETSVFIFLGIDRGTFLCPDRGMYVPRFSAPLWAQKDAPVGARKCTPGAQKDAPVGA